MEDPEVTRIIAVDVKTRKQRILTASFPTRTLQIEAKLDPVELGQIDQVEHLLAGLVGVESELDQERKEELDSIDFKIVISMLSFPCISGA